MRFDCDNSTCLQSQKNGKLQRWKTLYGLVFVTFRFETAAPRQYKCKGKTYIKKAKYPYLLEYDLQLFRQKCEQCQEMTTGTIY
jgi:hypothetical protein